MNKKPIIIVSIFILLVVGLAVAYFVFPEFGKKISRVVDLTPEKPRVIDNEQLVIPDTKEVKSSDRFNLAEGNVQTPLVPKNEGEKVIVSKAVFTVKGAYDFSKTEASQWSNDAKLAYIKSFGAVTLEGKSSQWQLVFTSLTKKGKGYEIIVQADQIVSKKEIDSNAIGADVPENFKDSDRAITVLQELPQYSDATLSVISLYFNTDIKAWRYNLVTSKGVITVPAKQ